MARRLAWVETSVPGPDPAARAAELRRHGLAVEVPLTDGRETRRTRDHGLEVACVQAHKLHEQHFLSPRAEARRRAVEHVVGALEAADEVGARRVLTVCGFGDDLADDPLERCVEGFAAVAPTARRFGVRIGIELLSPARCAAMQSGAELAALLDRLGCPDVFDTVLDTGHLLDAGLDPVATLTTWDLPLGELQLKGAGSSPPLGLDLRALARALPGSTELVCVEHRAPIDLVPFEGLCADLSCFLTPP